jgi:hypothetical protein
MKANTVAQKHLFGGLNIDWSQLRAWRQKTLTREGVAEIALFASTATVLGYLVWCAAKAAENYTILGLG